MGCKNTTKHKSITKANKTNGDSTKNNNSNTGDGKNGSGEKNSIGSMGGIKNSSPNKKELNDNESELNDNPKDISKNCLKITVEASTVEKMFPVWITKDVKTKIYVRGKWGILSECGMTNYKGHTNCFYSHRNCSIGALIGRVQGGDYFPVTDEMTLTADASGPIFFFANNNGLTATPKGALNVYIENGKMSSYEEIEKMSGWDIDKLNTAMTADYLNNEEKMIIYHFNKIRTDPARFSKQYIQHLLADNGNGTQNFKEIYEKLLHYQPMQVLKPSKALFHAAMDHARDMGENGSTGHQSSDNSDLKARILKYCSNPIYFGENCCYNFKDPLSVVLNMLADSGYQSKANRGNILNDGYDQIGVSIQPHYIYKWNCVQVFGTRISDKNGI
jgi:uncharacterized protein YkwD